MIGLFFQCIVIQSFIIIFQKNQNRTKFWTHKFDTHFFIYLFRMSINKLKSLPPRTSPYWVVTQYVYYSHTISSIHKSSTQVVSLLKWHGKDSTFPDYLVNRLYWRLLPSPWILFFTIID